jgi:hypothetical protein
LIIFGLQIESWHHLSYEQAHTLILNMQEATTTKTIIKEQVIQENVMP